MSTIAGEVMFIDDEEYVRDAGCQTLELADYAVQAFASAEEALARLAPGWPGVVVSDIRLPGIDGMAFMRKARQRDPDLPVVLITGHGDIAMAVEAMRAGAYDFIEKPFAADRLRDVVGRACEKRRLVLENRRLREELSARRAEAGPRIIGRTTAMTRLCETIASVADTDADVLVFGETGTGKELVARRLHAMSGRERGNFVAINCGAMPETIFESELFGHEPGAFTGAGQRRIGKLEYASGGTLFLDEIESMPMALQVKLLRVLQERVIERLGSNEVIPVDLRVIAATKVDLKAAAAAGTFREDLYYRLNVVVIPIPPLRGRRDDVPLLFHHFASEAEERHRRQAPPLDGERLHALMAWGWPGNVRELRNVAERYVLSGGHALLDATAPPAAETAGGCLPDQVASFEKSLIGQALEASGGSIKAAQEALGIPRKTLYDKLRKYGLDRKDYAG